MCDYRHILPGQRVGWIHFWKPGVVPEFLNPLSPALTGMRIEWDSSCWHRFSVCDPLAMTFICPTQCLSWVWRTDGVLRAAVWDCRVAMPTGTVESNHSHRWWKLEVPWPLTFPSKQGKLSYCLLNMHRNIMVLRLIQLTNTSTGEFKTEIL